MQCHVGTAPVHDDGATWLTNVAGYNDGIKCFAYGSNHIFPYRVP